jgi:hypothetical protein
MGKLTAQDHKKGDNWQSSLWVKLEHKITKREAQLPIRESFQNKKGKQLTSTHMYSNNNQYL